MGKFELALNLAKKTANFVKVCGKRSVLETKPFKSDLHEFIIPFEKSSGEQISRFVRAGKLFGEIRYGITKGNIGKYPDYYLEQSGKFMVLKPSVFVSHLKAEKCGTKLMQAAARDAKKYTDGRMVLDAQCVDGLTSPDAFYYKLGFRKLSQKENDMIKGYIERGETIPPETFSDRMFLPKENLETLLNYKKI